MLKTLTFESTYEAQLIFLGRKRLFFLSLAHRRNSAASNSLISFQLIAVVNQVRSLIDMHQVMCAGHFLYSHLREVLLSST